MRRTISGRWARPARAARARRSTTTSVPKPVRGEFPDDPGERFVEIWNLVFMQFDRVGRRRHDAAAAPFHRYRHGPGAHRRVLQGKLSNYDTDLLQPDHPSRGELFGVTYGDDPRTDVALRINADHAAPPRF